MTSLRHFLQRYGRAIGLAAALLGMLLLPASALAVDLSKLGSVNLITGDDLVTILGRVVDVILLWAGIIAFFYVLYGGFLYLTAGGDAGAVGKARTTILNAIIGIIIIALSYAIVNFVVSQTHTFGSATTSTTPTPKGKK